VLLLEAVNLLSSVQVYAMTLLEASQTLTIDEFVALPDSVRFELVDGVLVERKPMGALSDFVAMQIVILLGAATKGIGFVFGPDTTYRCFGDPNTGRRADVSFIARGRLPGDRIPEGYIAIPPDLAVEVISPNDSAYEVEVKVALYLSHGVDEVWVVYPITRSVNVHRVGQPIDRLAGDAVLHGRGVLSVFETPVSAFFPAASA
jgi:Uma2 family endonuclease